MQLAPSLLGLAIWRSSWLRGRRWLRLDYRWRDCWRLTQCLQRLLFLLTETAKLTAQKQAAADERRQHHDDDHQYQEDGENRASKPALPWRGSCRSRRCCEIIAQAVAEEQRPDDLRLKVDNLFCRPIWIRLQARNKRRYTAVGLIGGTALIQTVNDSRFNLGTLRLVHSLILIGCLPRRPRPDLSNLAEVMQLPPNLFGPAVAPVRAE